MRSFFKFSMCLLIWSLSFLQSKSLFAQALPIDIDIETLLAKLDTLPTDSMKVHYMVQYAGQMRYQAPTIALVERAQSIANASGDINLQGTALYGLGNYYYYQSKPDSALTYFDEALTLGEYPKMPYFKPAVYASLAGVHKEMGAIAKSIEANLAAKAIYEKADTTLLPARQIRQLNGLKATLYNSMASTYKSMKEYEEADAYYQLAYKHMMQNQDNLIAGIILMNLGELQHIQKQYEEALSSLAKAQILIEQDSRKVPRQIAMVEVNVGNTALEMGDYEKAQIKYEAAIEKFQDPKDNRGLVLAYTGLGDLYLRLKDYIKANDYCQEAFKLTEELSDISTQQKACECLYQSNKALGNSEAALRYFEEATAYKDSILNEENIKQFTALEMNYEFEKEQELVELKAQNSRRYYQAITGALSFVLIAAVFIALLLYRLTRTRRNANEQLQDKNAQISNALEEKEVLLKEIHHRVKNNLQVISSLLSLQGRQVIDPIAQQAIQEGKNRVKSMALIHQDLYQEDNLVGVSAQSYIQKLTQSLVNSYQVSPDRIQVKTDIEGIDLDVDTVIPLGLILNELISNALKYAFDQEQAGEISVSLKQKGQNLELKVMDNGKGLPSTFSPEKTSGLGYRLIQAFTKKLKGKLEMLPSNLGTQVLLKIPLA